MSMYEDNELNQEETAAPIDPIEPVVVAKPKRSRALFPIVSLLVLLLVAIGGVLILSPLARQILSRDPIAEVIPSDAGVYMSVDLFKLTSSEATRLRDIYRPAITDLNELAETNFDPDAPESFFSEIDKELAEEWGLTFADDIMPWAGLNAGIAVLNLNIPPVDPVAEDDPFGFPMMPDPEMSWLAVMAVRDETAADNFINKLQTVMIENGFDITSETYQEVTVYYHPLAENEAEFSAEESLIANLAFARSGDMFLLGGSQESVHQAITAQNGDSLGDLQAYQNTVKSLPSDAFSIVYVNATQAFDWARQFEEMNQQIMAVNGLDLGETSSQFDMLLESGLTGMAFSITAVAEGLQMDTVSLYDTANLSDYSRTVLDSQQTELPQSISMLPQETVMFIGARGADELLESQLEYQQEQMAAMMDGATQEEMEEAMAMFTEMFGFDLFDIFPHLGNEFAMAIIPDSNGLLGREFGVDISLMMLVASRDDAALQDIAQSLSDTLQGDDFGLTIYAVANPDLATYDIVNPNTGDGVVMSYGVGNGYLIAGTTNSREIDALFSERPSLADNPRFQEMQQAFSSDMTPAMFMNIQALIDTLPMDELPAEELASVMVWVEPMQMVGMASQIDADDGLVQSRAILFIDAPAE